MIAEFMEYPSLVEQLTGNFYRWEKRGRGWQVWDYPVSLEPPFEPFYYHTASTYPVVDDGRKHTFFNSLIERIWKGSSQPAQEEPLLLESESSFELAPEEFTETSKLKEITISLPQDYKIWLETAQRFLLNLNYCSLPLSFEIIGTHQSIGVQMTCREADYSQLIQQLRAYFPEAAVSGEEDLLSNLWNDEKEGVVVDFGLSHEFMRPLKILKSLEPDPLIGLIGALEELGEPELGVFQILFQSAHCPWADSIMRAVTDGEGHSFFADAPEMASLAKEKIKSPLFAVVIRVAAQSEHEHRAWDIARGLASGLTHISLPPSNELIPLDNEDYFETVHREDLILRQTHRSGMLLNCEELGNLAHLPSASVRSSKLTRQIRRTKPAPSIAIGHNCVLGENIHQNQTQKVSLSAEQRLRHMYLIGATGTGKSTFLLDLIKQDMEQGLGIAVLDPHGDLIEKILGFVPEERFDDVILLDPSDSEFPIGLNILSSHSEMEKNVLASDLTAVFRRLSTSWGDQMNSVLGNAILAFLESREGGSLLELRRFLVEADYRRSFLNTVADQEVVYYWQREFPLLKGNPQAPILTRLNTFLRPKALRYMVSQQEGLNFEEILNKRKIFLVKLAQGLIGEENAYLLGTLLVAKIHQAAMARQALSQSERKHFYVYLDEFQNFITPSMSAILSGARKYHLGLILAHQDLRQLWSQDTELANSVISNPGARLCFRLGDFDASKLQEGFSFFNASDLQNLGIGEAIARIERAEYDFNLKVPAPPEVSEDVAIKRRAELVALSRQKYAIPKEKIEERLSKENRIIPVPPTPPAGQVIKEPEKKIRTEEQIIVPKRKPKKVEELVINDLPVVEGKGGREHKYLQALIKQMAEAHGYKAVIEQPTPDGSGSVDVGLEKDDQRVACEISLTTTVEQELGNIRKCLTSEFDKIVVISPHGKNLKKLEVAALKEFSKSKHVKILFFQPEEFFSYLEAQAADEAGKEERVKGYKVKVQYRPVGEEEKKTKREAVGKVVLEAMRRMKQDKKEK